jgi:hypothetical protein
VPLKRKCASAFWKDIIIRHNISCFITKNFKPGLLHRCQNICDMLESLSYKCSPCRIYCIFFGCFCPLGFEKIVYYQWEIFCSSKTTKFLGKKPLVYTLCKLTPLACWDCSVLLVHEHVLFTSLHSIPFNSFVHWLTPPLS